MEWNIRQAGISQMAFILIDMFRYRIGLDVKHQCDEIVFGQLTPLARFVHEDAQFAQMGSWQRWRKRNAGEYPRRLGASPLRAKALLVMPKNVMTRNILMNVVTELN